MTDDKLLNGDLKNLYDNYYESDVARKREIAAIDTFGYISDLARKKHISDF